MSPKTSMILNIIVAAILVTGASSADLTAIFGEKTAGLIIHLCAWIGAIATMVNAVMHGASPAVPGPLAPAPSVMQAQKIMDEARNANR